MLMEQGVAVDNNAVAIDIGDRRWQSTVVDATAVAAVATAEPPLRRMRARRHRGQLVLHTTCATQLVLHVVLQLVLHTVLHDFLLCFTSCASQNLFRNLNCLQHSHFCFFLRADNDSGSSRTGFGR